MTLADGLRWGMRVVHIGALAIWFGGGLLHLLLGPLLRPAVRPATWAAAEGLFRRLAGRCLWLLAASGTYLLFDRLANPRLGPGYVAVLAVKLLLIAGIAWIVSGRDRTRPALVRLFHTDPGWVILGLGAGALALGVVLTLLYEGAGSGL